MPCILYYYLLTVKLYMALADPQPSKPIRILMSSLTFRLRYGFTFYLCISVGFEYLHLDMKGMCYVVWTNFIQVSCVKIGL